MAKSRFRYGGAEYDLLTRPLFAEIAWIEDEVGMDFSDLRASRRTAATVLLSLRRAGVMLTWSDIMDASPDDLEWVEKSQPAEPDVDGDVDPQAAGGEAGAEAQPASDPEGWPVDETAIGF